MGFLLAVVLAAAPSFAQPYPPYQPPNATSAFTETEKQVLLDRANQRRDETAAGLAPSPSGTQPSAADMNRLLWDEGLAAVAQAWVDTCPTGVNFDRVSELEAEVAAGNSRLPQEAIVSTGELSYYQLGTQIPISTLAEDAVDAWYETSEEFTFGPYDQSSCSSPDCGNFTQLAWADTRYIGCGYAACDDRHRVYCDFYPPGNWIGQAPWQSGASASSCPADTIHVDGSLCAGCDFPDPFGCAELPASFTPVTVSEVESQPACPPAPMGGSAVSAEPTLLATLADRWHEAWLGSPAVADLDGDGTKEILAPRNHRIVGWHLDGSIVFQVETDGARIYAPPVVADLDGGAPGLEVAAAAGDTLYAWDATGALLPGFPVTWLSELRAVAAHDIDGDNALELVVVSTQNLAANGQKDVVQAFESNGTVVAGFPPNTTGTAGCDAACFVTGGFGQTLALGDLDADGEADLVVPHDNAFLSVHRGSGVMFDASSIFSLPTKIAGVRFLFDYDEAKQGFSLDQENANQTIHTKSAPAIADLDGDGIREVILLGLAQNAAQTDWERGVGLWVFAPDGTRKPGWESPYHAPDYLSGLFDFPATNILGASSEVAVGDLDPLSPGLEMVFAGLDGRIHAVASDRTGLWTYPYSLDPNVLTSGVVLADLSGDGLSEVVFSTYSVDAGKSDLFVLGHDGALQHRVPLAGRGAMPVPTVADVDDDGTLEIVVSHKDAVDLVLALEVYSVAGSSSQCMPWPTGRGSFARTGAVLPEPGGISALAAGLVLLTFLRQRRVSLHARNRGHDCDAS